MENKSLEYRDAIKASKRYVKGKVELYSDSTLLYTFLPTDFLVSIDIERTGSNGKSFGYTIAQKAKVKIIDIHRAFNIQTGQTFKVYLGVETPDGIEYSNFPTFTIFEDMIQRDEETGDLKFEGFDMIGVSQRMYAADIPNIDYLAYTGPITGYLDALGQALGTTSVYTGAANLSKIYEEGAHVDVFGHEILRNVIRQAAEITGSIAFIDNSNRLCFKPLIPTSVKEISKDDYFDFKSGESQKLSMINHANSLGDTNTVGEELPGHFVQNLHNNSFIALLEENERQVLLGNVLTTASQATLRDMELEWRGDPALEIGDFITINGDFTAPIIKDTISYDGGMNQVFSYSVKGEPEDPLRPSSLPEALKRTEATVNKLEQNIKLAIYRTEYEQSMNEITYEFEGITERVDNVELELTPESITQKVEATTTLLVPRNEIADMNDQIAEMVDQQSLALVGEIDERITNYSSEVDQRFDSVTTTFSAVTTEIGDLGNELQTSLDEISTYIRFSIDGIELGELNNPIKLFVENDRIVFMQNDVEVAYIDNNKLYITDGEFLNSLRLGNFAFTPRDNGNLSFGKVT